MHLTHTPVPTEYEPELPLYLPNQFSTNDSLISPGKTASLSASEEKSKGKGRALVVDDAPDVTEMLAMLLRTVGYNVVMAFTAGEALDLARGENFDIVISDIGMPGMNG